MAAVTHLQLGRSMHDRSKVMIQTKRDTLVLQIGFGVGLITPHCKTISYVETSDIENSNCSNTTKVGLLYWCHEMAVEVHRRGGGTSRYTLT